MSAIDWSDKEQKRAYMKEWRAANSERLREYDRQYRASSDSYQQWKRANDKRYYEQAVKADPARLQRMRQTSAEWANNNRPRLAMVQKTRYHADPERYRATALRAYHAKPEEERKTLRMARAEYMEKWREAHKHESREYFAERHAANRAEFNRQSREYYEQNKLAFIKRANARRTLLTGTYKKADIDQMYIAQGGKCAGCVCDLGSKYEIDHIMPLSLDPSGDVLENLQLLCMPCNRKKSDLHPDQWAARLEKLSA